MNKCLTNQQQRVVTELLQVTTAREERPEFDREIFFQSPTGSGKTLMIANFINEYLLSHSDQKTIFLLSTISSGKLNDQNYQKLLDYRSPNTVYFVRDLNFDFQKADQNDYEISIKLDNKTVYCLGNASFGEKRILYKRGYLKRFLADASLNGYKIIYLRDESHIGYNTKNDREDSTNLLELMRCYATTIIHLSATLTQRTKQAPDVEMTLEEAAEDHLIKGTEIRYAGIDPDNLSRQIDSQELVTRAVENFRTIQAEYDAMFHGALRPAMLIQVNGRNSNKYDEEQKIQQITNLLDQHHLKWCKYFNGSLTSSIVGLEGKEMTDTFRELITKPTSEVDVIIFKVAIATGWDIPRACVLLQVREIYSEVLNWQTIGRIRRNPLPEYDPDEAKLKINDLTDKYWIYSNVTDFDRDLNKLPLKLKPNYQTITFDTIACVPKQPTAISNQIIVERMFDLLNKSQILKLVRIRQGFPDRQRWSIEFDQITATDSNKSQTLVKYVDNWFELQKLFRRALGVTRYQQIGHTLEFVFNKFADQNQINVNDLIVTLLNRSNKHLWDQLIKTRDCFEITNYILQKGNKVSLPVVTYSVSNSKYEQHFDVNAKKFDHHKLDQFAYEFQVTSPDQKKQKQLLYFDSDCELFFFEKMVEFVGNKPDFQLYTKHYLENSKLGFAYQITDEIGVHVAKSYPDFIFKWNNKWCFCEVKPVDESKDYNSNKTKALTDAYSQFAQILDYAFAIVKVDPIQKYFSANLFYGQESFQNNFTNFAQFLDQFNQIIENVAH